VPIDQDFYAAFEDAYRRMAGSGERVLGFAYARFRAPTDRVFDAEEKNFPLKDMIFVGLTGALRYLLRGLFALRICGAHALLAPRYLSQASRTRRARMWRPRWRSATRPASRCSW
jgi:hypothetical protein